MNRVKKLISVFTAAVMTLSVFALAFTAFGKSQELTLNVKQTSIIDGEDDLAWFYYTPEKSGVYSFLSYNIPASEAYLFIKEKVDGTKQYVQLAYATDDENYVANEHNSRQFCLTYHLEEGVKYYFTAGWYLSESRTSGNMNVMLRCDRYDDEIDIVSLEATTTATLDAFSGGSFALDENGSYYYRYNYSRIISNTKVVITYSDGTVSEVYGKTNIDGYPIVYSENQINEHWYPQGSDEYTSNRLTVSVLDQSCDMEVVIEHSALYQVTGVVTDTAGNPVSGADISINNSSVAKTSENGEFAFAAVSGAVQLVVSADNAFDRTVNLTVAAQHSGNDFSKTPIVLCCSEYVSDGVINAKDYAAMKKALAGTELERAEKDYGLSINKRQEDFPPQNL